MPIRAIGVSTFAVIWIAAGTRNLGRGWFPSCSREAALIFLAVLILRSGDRKQFLLPIISIVVGLDFFGLVWALGSNEYWFVGGAMCLLSILTNVDLTAKSLGVGCGPWLPMILWFSVIGAFF